MKTINGQKLKEILISGANALSNNKERIDVLNVFPVPDGDTGSNMWSTAEYSRDEIKNMTSNSVSEISSKFARGMLLGARGNSGVILSQILKGFSIGLENKDSANSFEIVNAFKLAKEYAYKSVMSPIEGTILTVIRETADNLDRTVTASNSIEDIFTLAAKFARESTNNTPELLPVLKEVGVVDSGGEGLTVFIDGMLSALIGKFIEPGNQINSDVNTLTMNENYEGEFGYCTEFILDLKNQKTFNKEKFEKTIIKFGNSMVIVRDENIVKIHIHSHKPGEVLTFALKYGQFLKIKIDNMTMQANEGSSNKNEVINSASSNGIAVITCNTGQGIINDMKELGAHFIIEAGQSSNPSAADFINAIEETNVDKIIILPNNSNIILAAQQVAQTSEKEVIIIPSKTQMQGLAAMMNFDPEGTIKDNKESMEEAITSVKTGQVTKAVRTTKIEGVSVREGEYLAIAEKKIIKSTNSKVQSAISISKELIDEDTELVTIYYGDDSTQTDAEEVSSFIETNFEVEVEIKAGDQQVYNFLISYE